MAFLLLSVPLCLRGERCFAWEVTSVSSLHKLTARQEGVLKPFPREPVLLQAVRGEWENFQVVLTADTQPLKIVRVDVEALRAGSKCIPDTNVHLFRENFVYVAHPSGNRELTPQWWPDALLPLEDGALPALSPHRSCALWVNVRVPSGAQPGRYTSTIRVSTDQGVHTLPFAMRVFGAQLPPPTYHATVAVYYDLLREWYRKAGYTFTENEWDAQKKRYYDFLLDYRLCAYDLPIAWNDPQAERYLRDERVHSVRLPPLDSPDFPAAQQLFARTQTRDKAFYYRIDEPAPERFKDVRAATTQLHARDSHLRHLVTVHPNAALNGAVDIWCPDIGDIFGLGHLDFNELARQRSLGRGTWFYTMVEPKSPYPTWLLDDDATSVRIYGAIMARYGIQGFVYSMAHGWGPHPLRDLTSFAGTNGDGTLLYPGELVGVTGPMPSIRLMLLRDALEDAELLKMASYGDLSTIFQWTTFLLPAPHGVSLPPGGTLVGAGTYEAPYSNWKQMRQLLLETVSHNGYFRMLLPFGLPKNLPFTLPRGAVHVDGHLNDHAWNAHSLLSKVNPKGFARGLDDPWYPPLTQMWVTRDTSHLYVAIKCAQPQNKEWVAVEIASANAHERWRFIVTRKGVCRAEHHTREGQFQADKVEWKGAHLDIPAFWNAEFRIPLVLLGNPTQFRFNAIRRTQTAYGTRVLLRFEPDAGDVTLMPLVR